MLTQFLIILLVYENTRFLDIYKRIMIYGFVLHNVFRL